MLRGSPNDAAHSTRPHRYRDPLHADCFFLLDLPVSSGIVRMTSGEERLAVRQESELQTLGLKHMTHIVFLYFLPYQRERLLFITNFHCFRFLLVAGSSRGGEIRNSAYSIGIFQFKKSHTVFFSNFDKEAEEDLKYFDHDTMPHKANNKKIFNFFLFCRDRR